jgi:uncharacterized protein (DUF1697 family)
MSVILLRGANVGTSNRLDSKQLARCLTEATGETFHSLLASGNFCCTTDICRTRLERSVSACLAQCGCTAEAIVLDNARLRDTLRAVNGVFPDPSHVLIYFAKAAFDRRALKYLSDHATRGEVCRIAGDALLVDYGSGIHGSRITTGLIDRELGTVSTGRNLNTLARIAAALE